MTKKILTALVMLATFGTLLVPVVFFGSTGKIESATALAQEFPQELPRECTITRDEVSKIVIDPANDETCPGTNETASLENQQAICCVFNSIYTAVNWIFIFLMVIVIFFVIIGAFYLLTAGGSPDKITLGRNFILWAAVGFAVALLARAVPGVVLTIMGIKTT